MQHLYRDVYENGNLFGVDKKLSHDPLTAVSPNTRKNSIAIEGGAFGDEGKGRIVDQICTRFAQAHGKVIVYRWNGGANAGHTVVINGQKIALHQLPSGSLTPCATVILGKGMVLHPGDLVTEIAEVLDRQDAQNPPEILIDEMAVLALDTHRAFEVALKRWESGGKGSTERGISPAYADVLYRHPVRVRDLKTANWAERLGKHYDLYEMFLRGLGGDLASSTVRALGRGNVTIEQVVGSKSEFLARIESEWRLLLSHVRDVSGFIRHSWQETDTPFVFEGAQAVGLDARFGVYPDITASDPTFGGIVDSTEGIIKPDEIAIRAGAIKATYTSSVGSRVLPTMMEEKLAHQIREDAHEYGATTRRPRDIAYIDIPCLGFFARVSDMTHLVLTHLDIAYSEVPIKVCTHYTNASGEIVPYRPDQEYLNTVTPHYLELPSWDGKAVEGVRDLENLPREAQQYIAFLTRALNVAPIIGTTGAERESLVSWMV